MRKVLPAEKERTVSLSSTRDGEAQEGRRTDGLLGDHLDVLLGELEVERDGGRLDCDTTLLLVITGKQRERSARGSIDEASGRTSNAPGVHEPGVTGLRRSNDTGLGDERVGKGRLSVVDWRQEAKAEVSD